MASMLMRSLNCVQQIDSSSVANVMHAVSNHGLQPIQAAHFWNVDYEGLSMACVEWLKDIKKISNEVDVTE